ncbi:MAG: MBL fold metallo-hydrolase [Holophaga sp.]|jgi:L-ascorbate metabolism protein UlaG (beta-lactamase superfamily)
MTRSQAPSLTYFGRASVKLVASGGYVVYIDPFAPGDYSEPADLVLVTHGHDDHNKVSLVALKPNGVIAAPVGAVPAKDHRPVKEGDTFTLGPVRVRVVPAYNSNHQGGACVGYVLTVDGVTVYHAGDTSLIPEMKELAPLRIDYALFPTDGYWNMGGAEARRCADLVQAHHVAAIHSSPMEAYDAERAALLAGPDVLRLGPGQRLALEAGVKA